MARVLAKNYKRALFLAWWLSVSDFSAMIMGFGLGPGFTAFTAQGFAILGLYITSMAMGEILRA